MTTRHVISRPPIPSCRPSARALRVRAASTACWIWLLVVAAGCDRTISLEEARALHAQDRYAETVEPLRKRLDASPDDPEAHLLYGTALSKTGSPRVAVWSLRKAAESPEWTVPATIELAAAHARASNWKEAIEAAEAVLELEPDNLAAHIVRGEAYLSEGEEPEKALEDFDFVLEQDPMSRPALSSRASVLLLVGRVDEASEAIDQLEALAAGTPGDELAQAELCTVQSVLLQERGELTDAESRFEDCLERFPSQGVVVEAAMGFFDAKGDFARSTAVLEKALELAPESIIFRRTLAMRAQLSGDPEKALAILKDGLSTQNPELRTALWTDITNYHVDRDELPEAIAAYEEALALVDHPPQISILTHADLLARAGRHADALRVAKGLENDAYVGLIEARIALDQGDPKRALARLDEVFPTWPNNAGARYYAARAAEQMGDFARAIEEYRQSLRSAPQETEAGLRLAKLYLAAGSFQEAWNLAGQYVMVNPDDVEGGRVVAAAAAKDEDADLQRLLSQMRGTRLWPAAAAVRAQFVAGRKDAKTALAWLDSLRMSDADWNNPGYAELLRTRILLLDSAGDKSGADKTLESALAAQPESSEFLEIRAALLESRGAAAAEIRVAFEQALEKDEGNWLANEGLARALEQAGDFPGAIAHYDRSTQAHPESPIAARKAAALAAREGDRVDSEKRWALLLKEHPWDAEAARALTLIRKDRGETDDVTLDYAERAVMFGGGKEAEALLIQIHEARGEKERAQDVARAFEQGKPIPPKKPRGANPGAGPEAEKSGPATG